MALPIHSEPGDLNMSTSLEPIRIAIVGGGAAGFFTAINAADYARSKQIPVQIVILESSDAVLRKVKISGGGRCNVTHHQFIPREFCKNYPRGEKELISCMNQFQAQDTVNWFAKRGVKIVPEDDGRMFPDTNTSDTVIDCFLRECKKLDVDVRMQNSVLTIVKNETGEFEITIKDKKMVRADKVLIATGSSQHGHKLAEKLGHAITELAPSLFSFKIDDPFLKDLSGLSVNNAKTKLVVGKDSFEESGPVLITHWGLSGPGILKISAWSAREMLHSQYLADLYVNWISARHIDDAIAIVQDFKQQNLKSKTINAGFQVFAARLWERILKKSKIDPDKKWADVNKQEIRDLATVLFSQHFKVLGKNRYKDEFVECGGVSLKEIDFKKMESKICPGLFFAGEILDIDGITGGFNFQNAWTGGFIASRNMI
jgi:predicted Rossmann fold flavoprotein